MKRFFNMFFVLFFMTAQVCVAAPYLGDFVEDETVHFIWHSNDGDGGSITRATNGTISVYKDNGVTQSVAGVTDTEDFDSLTGVHACAIDLSADAFYAIGANYTVVISAAVIDGQTVNAVLAHFSIENRFDEVDVVQIENTDATDQIRDHAGTKQIEGSYTSEQLLMLLSAKVTGKITIDKTDPAKWDITYYDINDVEPCVTLNDSESDGARIAPTIDVSRP